MQTCESGSRDGEQITVIRCELVMTLTFAREICPITPVNYKHLISVFKHTCYMPTKTHVSGHTIRFTNR